MTRITDEMVEVALDACFNGDTYWRTHGDVAIRENLRRDMRSAIGAALAVLSPLPADIDDYCARLDATLARGG